MALLTAVLVNYNSFSLVCARVQQLSVDGANILIVDNGSPNGDGELLVHHFAGQRHVRVIASAVNGGFGAGVNLAMEALSTEDDGHVVWLVNPDLSVDGLAIRALLSFFRDFSPAIASPLVLQPGAARRTWWAGGDVRLDLGRVRHQNFNRPAGATSPKLSFEITQFVSGAAMAFDLRTWRMLGPFESSLFMYWEDVDWCVRAAALDVPRVVILSADVTHEEGRTSSTDSGLSALYYYYMARNRLLVCAPHSGRPAWVVALLGLAETLRLLLKPVLRERAGRWPKFLAALRGTRDGLTHRVPVS